MIFNKTFLPKNVVEIEKQFEHGWNSFRTKRDRAVARMHATEDDLDVLTRLDGLTPATRSFVATNGGGRQSLARHLYENLLAVRRDKEGLQWLHITILLKRWTTGDLDPLIDLDKITLEATRTLNCIAPDWSAVIELSVFANCNYSAHSKLISPHVHAIVWGREIYKKAVATINEYNPLLPVSTEGMKAVKVQKIRNTALDLARVVFYHHKAPDRCKTSYRHPITGKTNIHESEKGDRFIRYLRMHHLMSRLRQRELLFAGGDGVTIQQHALRAVERQLRAEAAQVGKLLSMPEIQRFWKEFMPKHGRSQFRTPKIIRPTQVADPRAN